MAASHHMEGGKFNADVETYEVTVDTPLREAAAAPAANALGMSVRRGRSHFKVDNFKTKGAIVDFNQTNQFSPVREGDEIVAVNGATKFEDVHQAIAKGGPLHFVFRGPARPTLSQFLPVWFEWLMAIIIWASTFVWAMCPEVEHHRWCPECDRWMPAAVMWLAAYPMFFNLVNRCPSPYDWFNYTMNWVCLLACARYGALLPFLCGGFCGPVFVMPVMVAAERCLSEFDTDSYLIGVGWTTGMSNGVMFLAQNRLGFSTHARFVIQVLGWTAVMSGIPILMQILGMEMPSYKLTLPQTIRYSAFQLSIYTFIYYGVCRNFEGGWVETPINKTFDSTH